MTCARCGHLRVSHAYWGAGPCRAFGEDAPCDCPAFVPKQETDDHRWCYAEFHRCDGGGPGEFYAYTDNRKLVV